MKKLAMLILFLFIIVFGTACDADGSKTNPISEEQKAEIEMICSEWNEWSKLPSGNAVNRIAIDTRDNKMVLHTARFLFTDTGYVSQSCSYILENDSLRPIEVDEQKIAMILLNRGAGIEGESESQIRTAVEEAYQKYMEK